MLYMRHATQARHPTGGIGSLCAISWNRPRLVPGCVLHHGAGLDSCQADEGLCTGLVYVQISLYHLFRYARN